MKIKQSMCIREHTYNNPITVVKPYKVSYCYLCDQACMTHALGFASNGQLCDHAHLSVINTLCCLLLNTWFLHFPSLQGINLSYYSGPHGD